MDIELLRKTFCERDGNTVDDYNRLVAYHGVTIESRLKFTEDRLADICGVVVHLMKLLEEQNKNQKKED